MSVGYDEDPGGDFWTYRLQKLGGATYTYQRAVADSTDSTVNKEWWGIEVWNDASQFGGPGAASAARISEMAYSTGYCCESEPTWTYSVVLNTDWNGGPSAWSGTNEGLTSGHTWISGYTTNH